MQQAWDSEYNDKVSMVEVAWIMMQIDVSQLLKEPVGSLRDYKVSGTVDLDGGSKVQGEVNLTRTNRSVLVRGRLYTEVDLTCARCLNLFSNPLVLNIEDEFFPVTDVASGVPLPPADEAGYFTIDEHQVLDLTEAARQYALVAIPMKPLCRKDCAGLQSPA